MKIRPTRACGRSIERVTAAYRREKPLFARVTHRVLGESDARIEDARQKTSVRTYAMRSFSSPFPRSSNEFIIYRITRDILNKLNPINRHFRNRKHSLEIGFKVAHA